MARVLAVLAMLAVWPASPTAAKDAFPYAAYVNSDESEVRSGPGTNYYVVQLLRTDDVVVVYRHDPGGWYAIRPTDQSFSWVAADYVSVDDQQIGTIIADRVAARVGSSLSDIRDVIQVRLERSEQVEVLGSQRLGTGPTAQLWYKIAPPRGEFRWVDGKFLERSRPRKQPTPLAAAALPAGFSEMAGFERVDERDPGDDFVVTESRKPLASPDGDLPPELPAEPMSAERKPDHPGLTFLARGREGLARQTEGRSKFPTPEASSAARLPAADSRWSRSKPHSPPAEAEGADEINVDLTRMVAGEPARWDFASLRQRAQRAIATSLTAAERERERALLARIERFEEIRARSSSQAKKPDPVPPRQRASSGDTASPQEVRWTGAERPVRDAAKEHSATAEEPTTSPQTSRSAKDLTSADPRFDGVGRLAEVVTRQIGDPRFVLLDDAGEARFYLTPAPGTELQPFIGQRIGVQGTLGYMVERRAQHISVKRVTAIDAPAAAPGS